MKMLRITLFLAALTSGWLLPCSSAVAGDTAHNAASKMLRDASLMLMREGNDRYVSGKTQHPNSSAERRSSTVAGGQEPFATVLACSDSRVPVELLFDRGVGDLFVIRVAGNIAGGSELASMEYGVGHLGTPVLVVLGHEKCGAVTAVTKGAELHGHLHALAEKIQPAAEKAKAESTNPTDLVPRAIQANVWNTMESILRESSEIREKVANGAAHIVGAIYDLESGKVAWLGAHPAQDAIVALANQAQTDAALAKSTRSLAPGGATKTQPNGTNDHPVAAASGTRTSGRASTHSQAVKPSKVLAAGGSPGVGGDAHDPAPAPAGRNH